MHVRRSFKTHGRYLRKAWTIELLLVLWKWAFSRGSGLMEEGKLGRETAWMDCVRNWACVCLRLRRTWGRSRETFNHIQLLSWWIGKHQACVSVYWQRSSSVTWTQKGKQHINTNFFFFLKNWAKSNPSSETLSANGKVQNAWKFQHERVFVSSDVTPKCIVTNL